MGIGTRPYKFIMQNSHGIITTSTHKSLNVAIFNLLHRLSLLNSLNSAEDGVFKNTKNPFTGEMLTKRYVVEINAPFTIFEIKKQTKGSLNEELFMETLKNIKEEYFERV